MTYEKAVTELFYSLFGTNPSNFHAELYFLIGKADPVNRELLRKGYPMEIMVFEEWQSAQSQGAFFARWGLKAPV